MLDLFYMAQYFHIFQHLLLKTTVRLLNGQILQHLRHKVEHHILWGAGGGCCTSSTWPSTSISSSISFSSKIKTTVRLLNGQILKHLRHKAEHHILSEAERGRWISSTWPSSCTSSIAPPSLQNNGAAAYQLDPATPASQSGASYTVRGRKRMLDLFYMARFFHIFQLLLLKTTVRLLNSYILQHRRHKVEHHKLWEAGSGCWTPSTWPSSFTSSSTSFSSNIKTTVRLLNSQTVQHNVTK